MTRPASLFYRFVFGSTLVILTAGSALAQQAPKTTGGWRRVGDQPPATVTDSRPAPAPLPTLGPDGQDPTQPVDRSDAYGQAEPQAQSMPPSAAPPADRPMYGSVPQELTIRPGTYVTVRVNEPISSDRNAQGDLFTATLMQPLVVDGIVVAQRGQTVYGRVAEAQKAGRAEGVSHLRLELTGVSLVDGNQAQVRTQMVTRNGRTDVGSDVAAVGTTTAVGAAIGAAADWGRGAAIGAGAGAAAGLIGVLLTRGHATVVYPETVLTFQTVQPVVVSTLRAPQAFRYVGPEDYNHQVAANGPPPRLMPRPAPYYAAPMPYYYPGWYGYPYPYYGPYYGVGVGVVIRGGRWHRW